MIGFLARPLASGLLALAGGLVALVLATGTGAAAAQSGPYATARLISEYASLPVGAARFRVALELRLQEGWHVYWRNPGDSGLPPTILWDKDAPLTGDFHWPLPHEQSLGTLMNYGYEDRLVLPFTVRMTQAASGETVALGGEAEWLICKDICIPESARVDLDLPVTTEARIDPAARTSIEAAIAASPVPLNGAARVQAGDDGLWRLSVTDERLVSARGVRFFPDGHAIAHAAKQRVYVGTEGVSLDLTPLTSDENLPEALTGVLAVDAGGDRRFGLRLSAREGALLPGTRDTLLSPVANGGEVIAGLGGTDSPGSFLLMLVMAFLGGLILNLLPCVLPVLAVKAVSLAESTKKDHAELRAQAVAWTAGVVTCFLAIGAVLLLSRAAGEQIGIGFQLQYPPMTALLALILFVIGLNLIGVFEMPVISLGFAGGGIGRLADSGGRTGAFFTGLLAAFVGAPCVGPLLGAAMASVLTKGPITVMAIFAAIGFGMALPMSAIGFSPSLARLIPRPGRFMQTFRQFLAFPIFLAMLWLLWVLAAQTGSDGILGVLLAAIVIAFGLWSMGALHGTARFLALPVIALGLVVGVAENSRTTVQTSAPDTAAWSPERIAELRADGKPILVDFTARWCITCQVNKRTTLTSVAVRRALTEGGVTYLVADWTNRDPAITAELAAHGRIGVPLYLLYPKGSGPPEVLPQILTPSLVVDSIRRAVDSGALQSGTGKKLIPS